MEAWFHTLWQKAKKPLEVFCIIIVCILVIVLLVVIALAYIFNVNVSGLRGKTLWDWLQLLIIPAVLAVGGYLFNLTVSRNEQNNTQLRDQTERDIASDNQREDALQAYIDKMSELLLRDKLRDSTEDDEVRKIARVRTLTVLPRLDKERKRSVLQFLHESGLIKKDKTIIDLREADLRKARLDIINQPGANLSGATLMEADLSGANLESSNLSRAKLIKADLSDANLSSTDLTFADLTEANLRKVGLHDANLSDAILEGADLRQAELRGKTILKYSKLK